MGELFAFSIERTSRLTGLSVRQLEYWDRTGFFSPEFASADKQRPRSRVYSFRDLVALRTLAQLRSQVSLQELRKLGQWLRQHYDTPWSSLRFYLTGRKVIVADPQTGMRLTLRPPGEQPLPVFEMEEIARDTRRAVEQMRERDPQAVGKITRRRNVMSNAPVIAGTRIPTAAIWEFHEAGYDSAAILREYPQLTGADVEAAISAERQQRERAG